MQYGFPRLLLMLIVCSAVQQLPTLSKRNYVVVTAKTTANQERREPVYYLVKKNHSDHHYRQDVPLSTSNRRFVKRRNYNKQNRMITPNSVHRKPKKHLMNKCSRLYDIDDSDLFSDDDHLNPKNSYYISNQEQEAYLKRPLDEPSLGDQPSHYLPITKKLPSILDDIDYLIDEFEDVSKDLDLHHREYKLAPLDRTREDVMLWENAEQLACKERLDTDWTVWSAWSPCSVTCGRGVRIRSRFKLSENIPAEIEELQEKKCIMPDCPPFNLSKFISKVFFVR